jgi:UDP-glucose 4-epimerase
MARSRATEWGMTVLVTGGAGYIGSHMTYGLIDRGDAVVVLDNLSTGIRGLVSEKASFVQGEAGDIELVRRVISNFNVNAVIHFAGSIVVPESVAEPLKYYANNTGVSRALAEACVAGGVRNFIFSSTAAVYGMGNGELITETADKAPINPYGRSKLMTEWMLEDAANAYDFRFVALRYFNVAGADGKMRTGQSTPRATHLIKRACQVALKRAPYLEIFGTDYGTADGTGVRDYIHVEDLIAAHLLALDALRAGAAPSIYNCGYGQGYSVRQVVSAVERVTGASLPVRESPRRPGDPAMLIADSSKLKRELHWTPRHQDLGEIVRTAFEWERRFN